LSNLFLHKGFFKSIYEERDSIPYFKTYATGEQMGGRKYMDIVSSIDFIAIARVPRLSFSDVEPMVGKVYEVGRWRIRNTPSWRKLEILGNLADLIDENRDYFINVLMLKREDGRSG